MQEADSIYGPVITLNAYIPMAKYEIEEDFAEEDVRRICGQIATDLTALLRRSPAAVEAKGPDAFYGAPKFAQANSRLTRAEVPLFALESLRGKSGTRELGAESSHLGPVLVGNWESLKESKRLVAYLEPMPKVRLSK